MRPPSSTSPCSRQGFGAGFTLVELVVTIAIGGIVAAALFAFLASGQETARSRESQAEAQAALRLAVDRFARDARQAVTPDGEAPAIAALHGSQVIMYVDPRRGAEAVVPRPLLVRYALSSDRLTREEAEPRGATAPFSYGAYGPAETLAEPVVAAGRPVFTGLTRTGAPLSAPVADPSQVAVIRIDLSVAQQTGLAEGAARVATDVALRNGR